MKSLPWDLPTEAVPQCSSLPIVFNTSWCNGVKDHLSGSGSGSACTKGVYLLITYSIRAAALSISLDIFYYTHDLASGLW